MLLCVLIRLDQRYYTSSTVKFPHHISNSSHSIATPCSSDPGAGGGDMGEINIIGGQVDVRLTGKKPFAGQVVCFSTEDER